jgi:DNA-binding MarR family transcriptional regulator
MKNKNEQINRIFTLHQQIAGLDFDFKIDKWMKVDLTIDQLKSLIFIHANNHCNRKISFTELAEALGITRANVTGIAERLARNGLIKRTENPEDRRVQLLTLTEEGQSLLDSVKQGVTDLETRILYALDDNELDALEKGLSAYVESARSRIIIKNNGDVMNHPIQENAILASGEMSK